MAGEVQRYRHAIFECICKTSEWFDGVLSVAAQQYRTMIVNAYLPDTPEFRVRRMLLLRYAPGDWKRPRYQLLRQAGVTLEAALKLVKRYVIPIFAAHAPFLFPEHREMILLPWHFVCCTNLFSVSEFHDLSAGHPSVSSQWTDPAQSTGSGSADQPPEPS